MMGELSLYGVLFPPLLVSVAAAAVGTALLRKAMNAFRLYRWVWHAALFDLAVFVVLLGLVDQWISGGFG